MLSRKYLGIAGTISLSFGLMAGCSDDSTANAAKSITGGITADDIQAIADSAGIADKISADNVCLYEGYTSFYAADNETIMCMDGTGAIAFWINADGSYGFPESSSNDEASNGSINEGNAGVIVNNSSASAGTTGSISGNTATSSSASGVSGTEQGSGNTSTGTSSASVITNPSAESSSSVIAGCTSEKEAYTIKGVAYYFDSSLITYYYYDENCQKTYVNNQVTNSSASVGKSSASNGKSSASFGGNSSAVVSSSDSQEATSSETAVSSSATATSSSGTSIIGGGDIDDSDDEDAKTLDGSETLITVSGTSSTIQNDNGCLVQGDKKLTITCSGAYYFTGTASDYQVLVSVANASDVENVGIYLYNLDMTSTSAPFIVTNAEKTVFHIVKGTTNKLADGNGNHEFTKKDGSTDIADAVIYAKDDINFKGAGSLTLTSNYITASDTGSGIKCSNDIKIKNGNITITAQNNGIKGKGSVQISGGNLSITTKFGDGIKSDDCIETNGECTAVAADGKGFVNITGGTINVTAADDGIYGYNYVSIADTVETPKITIKTGSGSADKSSSESMGRPGSNNKQQPPAMTTATRASRPVSTSGLAPAKLTLKHSATQSTATRAYTSPAVTSPQ